MGDRLLRHIIKQNKPAKIYIKTENVTPAKLKTLRGNVEDPKRKKKPKNVVEIKSEKLNNFCAKTRKPDPTDDQNRKRQKSHFHVKLLILEFQVLFSTQAMCTVFRFGTPIVIIFTFLTVIDYIWFCFRTSVLISGHPPSLFLSRSENKIVTFERYM